MSEKFRGHPENEPEFTPPEELLDGPQPGFRRYTKEELKELKAQDAAHLDHLSRRLEDEEENEARDIGRNIILGQD
ncbi:MAG TPA: hypothetical protein VHC21_04425 [Candidatus Saccharimonadales bacterium]|nr:hypothetical protein [Candidatus Saccharimonadales bacterium]